MGMIKCELIVRLDDGELLCFENIQILDGEYD